VSTDRQAQTGAAVLAGRARIHLTELFEHGLLIRGRDADARIRDGDLRHPAVPPAADVGYRANNALVATDEPIVVPKDAGEQVQYEGELVAVIGKRCKRVAESEALDYVFGYTLGNDVSERAWQRGDRTFWRGKNTDTFKPMGPWIVTGLNPDDLRVTIRLNGKEMFTYAVKDAIFGVRQFISRMSQYLTLYPGDVLWMGTDGATENMKDGDVVEVECPEIGVLRNPVVRER